MTKLVIKEKEYNIVYGYKVTWKSGIVKKLVSLSQQDDIDPIDRIEQIMAILPEMLLIGLQKENEEYRFNYVTEEDKEDKIDMVCNILDDYFEAEDADFEKLLDLLQNEMLENGFLASMFQREKEAQKKKK